MIVTKYIQVELDPVIEYKLINEFIKDSLETDKETRFRRIKSSGPYMTFVKGERVDMSIDDLIGKER